MRLYRNHYRIESARLKNWDYSTSGSYFVTICVQDRKHHLGTIANGAMELSVMGEIANRYWQEIPVRFPFAHLDEYVIMPNHIHGIIEINPPARGRSSVGAVCCGGCINDINGIGRRDAINRVSTETEPETETEPAMDTDPGTGPNMDTADHVPAVAGGVTAAHNPMLNPFSLSKIIRWYKGRVAFEINRIVDTNGVVRCPGRDAIDRVSTTETRVPPGPPTTGMKPGSEPEPRIFAWQPRFHDSIIKSNRDLFRIKQYIRSNPRNWENDDQHSQN